MDTIYELHNRKTAVIATFQISKIFEYLWNFNQF